MALLDLLTDPFRPVFMQRALVEVLVLAIPAGLLGTWVVTRRLAFAAHAIGHATFPALVIAALAGWSLFGTSLVAAIAIALVLTWMSRRPQFAGGVAVAIVLSASLALGAVLVSDIGDPGTRANALLFGSLLAIDNVDIVRTVVVAILALALTLGLGRDLASATFQRDLAIADGRGVVAIDVVLMVMMAVTVAVALPAIGSLLVAALVLVPSATARLCTRRIPTLHVVGVLLAAAEGVAGLWLAYRLDAPPGAGIAVVAAAAFVIVAIAQRLRAGGPRQTAVVPT